MAKFNAHNLIYITTFASILIQNEFDFIYLAQEFPVIYQDFDGRSQFGEYTSTNQKR